MMGDTDLSQQMNTGGGGGGQSQEAQPQHKRSFFARHWPWIFILLSLVVAVLTFVGVIMNFTQVVLRANIVLINIYCLMFSLLALLAELRQFQWFRKLSYLWVKYVYVLTYYKPRGVFYILLGLLLLGNMAILYAAGVIAMLVGVVMLVTSSVVAMPTFEDPQERAREAEEARRYYEGQNKAPNSFIAKHMGHHSQGSKHSNHNGDSTIDGPNTTTGGGDGNDLAARSRYEPPTLPIHDGAGGREGGVGIDDSDSDSDVSPIMAGGGGGMDTVDSDGAWRPGGGSQEVDSRSGRSGPGTALFDTFGSPSAATLTPRRDSSSYSPSPAAAAAEAMPPQRQYSNDSSVAGGVAAEDTSGGANQLAMDFAAAMETNDDISLR